MSSNMETLNKHDDVSPEIVNRVKFKKGETEEKRRRCLNELRKLIEDEKDFYPCMDDKYLLRYLRVRKFDVKKAFENLKNYYIYQARYSGKISDLKPSDMKLYFDQCEMYVLDYRDTEDTCVTIIRLGKFDLDKMPLEMFITAFLICFEIGLEEELTQLCGYRLIFDFEGLNFSKFKKLASPSFLHRFVVAFQNVVPAQMKGFHFVNEPSYISGSIGILKMLMSRKLFKRISYHGQDLESLYKIVPREILPEEYGGTQGSMKMNARKYADRILTFEEFVEKRNEYGYKGSTLEKLRK